QTKVTATFVDENNKEYSDTRNIIVADGDSNVSLIDVSFKDGDLFMPLNATYKLAMVLTPANGFVQNEDFISSNLSVVTVDNSGLITAVGEGNAVISVDVNNGQFRKELNVYVDRNYTKNEIIITPETIFFDGELRKVKVGSVSKLSYTVRPNNADTSRLIWKSSDESVITVQNGVINAIREGRAVITVSALNGETDRVDIEVEKDIIEVKSISVDESVINLNVGRSKTITPVVNPDNASNKALSFTSLNDYVAFVDPNETGTKAKITGISEGNTSIVIEASNNVKKTIKVVVTDPNKQNAATPTPTPYDGGSNYWQPTATPYYWQPTATPYYWQPTATPYYWQPTATPRPTYTPTPRPTATPADPEIVCQTPVYNGSKQIVATCKNGKFTAPITTNSSIYEAVGKVDGQIFNLKCSNGIVTKSKDCSIKKRVIEPAGDCYDGLYLSPFSYCTVPSGKKCGLSGMAYLTTKVQTQSSTQRVSCTNIQQATPTPNIPTIKTSYA
ncbi:MAG: Ig-like domain-containing protein, partial [Bacilli bacterium]|nr:Ig-like domain-containing protein [Bacilli bacterium]